eukprot:gb/GEZN01006603.1/.p1 GENE.gb/GEZN01006603.1/~~gb/GEZN01006603.1/.p1  ORF type:complete len:495 (-),score=61.62 gb/GEZN01006603.1/:128-1612(-)
MSSVPKRQKVSASSSSLSSAAACSLDDGDVPLYRPSSSPISHDRTTVKLCYSFLSLLDQLKLVCEGQYAEERPGAPVFELSRDLQRGILQVTRYSEICHNLQSATTEARKTVTEEMSLRKQDLSSLDKEIATLAAAIEESGGEGAELKGQQTAQLHLLKGRHKNRIKALESMNEVEVKVKVERVTLRVEVVQQEENPNGQIEARLVPMEDPCIYVMGGAPSGPKDAVRTVERYNEKSNTWKAVTPMATNRYALASTAANGFVYAIGGSNGTPARFASVERFDVRRGCWEVLQPMSVPRDSCAAAVLQGKVYVCGGYLNKKTLSSVERFDPATGKWEDVASMTSPRRFCAAAVLDGLLYVMGGHDSEFRLTTVERFDPARNSWQLMPSMNQAHSGCAAAVLNGQLYVLGGQSEGDSSCVVERFDAKKAIWELVAPMRFSRAGVCAAVLSGSLYAIGGDHGGTFLSSVERYDDVTNTWELVEPMTFPCAFLAASTM